MESVTLTAKLPKIDHYSGRTMSTGRQTSIHKRTPPFTGLTGRSYSLSGNTEKFKLPPASALQPGVENHPGKLDSWPVHSLNPTKSNLSLGHRSSQFGSKSMTGHPTSVPSDQPSPRHKTGAERGSKPKFLEQLESYLSKELRLLGCPPCGPNELRLQAHREVFEYLVEDFKTYKPLLSAIKNEYELFIEFQQELIKELEPMEAHLEIVREDCERKIMTIREEDKSEDAAVQMENQRLKRVITEMKNDELSHKSQIERLEEQVKELYEKHRYEADARKLLISDFNDLKFRQQEQKGEEGGAEEEREDPVLLKLKLARAREDLRAANQRINAMLADYGDVVPRREFEMLETSYKTLESEMDALKNDHGVLIVEHSTLQSLYKDVLSHRDELKDELSQLKRSATPRPDWDRCSSYLEGGADKWAELTSGRSSDRKVDILLAQIAGVDVSEITKEDTLKGQGVGENVPRYLKFEGDVKNRHITRSETNELINGFWHHRLTMQEDQPLDETLFAFLLSRNDSDETLALEDGYNLQESVSRFAHEPHISLFGQVVRGELSESVFHRWLTVQTTLTGVFNEQQAEENMITEATLREALNSNLEGKPEDQLQALVSTANKVATTQSGMLDYIKLLSPDSEGQPSEFVILLLEQSRKESKTFVTELMQSFAEKSEVTLSDLATTLKELDPAKPSEDLHTLYSTAFSVPLAQVTAEQAKQLAISTTQLAERLQYCELTRTGMQ